jgi:hypothetical protein
MEIAGYGECEGSMECVSATIRVKGVYFERWTMRDASIFGVRVETTLCPSRDDSGCAPGLREISTRISGAD